MKAEGEQVQKPNRSKSHALVTISREIGRTCSMEAVPWCGHREAEILPEDQELGVRTPPCPEFICFSWVPLFLFSLPAFGDDHIHS